uniref:G-protein coupled receptors family 3 profile domain-containing protein n=1 Tax=Meloidogyne incognita TaxID=6306 RepID=A0A914KR39_MELIC
MNLLRQKFILLIILTTFFVPFTFSINVNIDSKIKQPVESAAAFDQSSEEGEEETTVTTKNSVVKEEQASCDVFDSFKVLPSDPGHFQIGGAFPLHTQDCLKLKPSSVQDVVAIQWAMAYWNEQTNKMRNATKRTRIGLFAGDSCSRPKEAISQSLRFLDAVGFHDPTECLLNNKEALRKRSEAPRLIAVLSPKDSESANSVAQALKPYNLPIAAFSSSSAQALLDQGVTGFISTAPLLFDYAQTLVELLKLIGNSNLVSIVDNNEDSSITDKFVEIIRQLNISISEIISVDHPNIINILNQSDAQIIVSLVNKNILATIFHSNKEFNSIAKLWVSIDWPNYNNGGGEDEETLDFINQQNANFVLDNSKAKLKFISIHRQQRYLADFNAYFLRVLVSNHEHYSLLNAYVRTVYNCNKTTNKGGGRKVSCENDQLNPARLAELHRQSASLESIIPLIFALARAAQRIDGDFELSKKCQTPSQPCFNSIRNELLELQPLNNSQLGIRLPPGFAEQLTTLRFFQPFLIGDFIQMEGIVLEAVFRENSGSKNIYKLIEYKTGASKNLRKFQLPSQLSNIHSYCRQNRPYCLGKCEFAAHRKEEQTFLSLLPQNSPLYIAALFDFQSGTNCNIFRRDNPEAVSLPLAFLHAISTFQQQFSPKSGLFTGADSIPGIGALLIDTCSNTKNLLEFLIDSERNCYKFTQMERNWTIANGATIGYLYGSEEELTSTQEGIFDSIFSNPAISPPLLTLGQSQKFGKSNLILSEFEEAKYTKNSFFHLGPSHKNTAIALAKFLKKMHWTYVNVVVDKSDSTSVSLYNQFMLFSTGICTSDVILIGDQQTTRFDEHNNIKESEHAQTSKKKRHDSTKTKQSQHLQTLLNVPNANVTLVFSSAKQAAEFMSARLRDEFMASGSTLKNVHIMIGEAHDFYLRDPTNLVQYAGTVSFQAKDLTTPEFHSWIRSITPLTLPEVWYWRHVEENWQCALSKSNIERFNGRLCTGEELLDVNGMGRLTRAGYLTRGIQLLLEAVDTTYKKLCPNELKPLICDEFNKNGRKLIRNTYAQLIQKEPVEYEIYQLVSNGDENNFGYKLFANYSSSSLSSHESTNSEQFHFISEYQPFIQNSEKTGGVEEELQWVPPIISRCRAPFCKCPSTRRQVDDNDDSDDTTTHHTYSNPYIRREPARPTMLSGNDEELLLVYDGTNFPEISQLNEFSMSQELNEALRIVFFVLSGILCVLAIATLLLILFKMYQRTIKGHQSLGILLLIGICSLYATGFLFASTPSNLICRLRISAHSLAHTLCFGVIIVKAIQLKNAETLATSSKQHTISYWNYWLLLAFIFAVQFVICMKWFLIEPLEYIIGAKQQNFQLFSQQNLETQKQHPLILLCSYSSPNFLLAQIYTFFLLLLALLLSSKNRSIKRNYKEAKWLFITSLSCTIILCLWAVSHVLISPVYLDFTTVIELQLTATLLLIFIFGPKLYVLLFYGPVVVECFYGGSGSSLNRNSKTTNITSTCSDLFETSGLEWNQHYSVSPTPSTTTSNAERSSSDERERETIVHNNDEKAFQTILRKKNNSNKIVQNNKNNKTLETAGKMLNKNTTSTTTK